MRVRALQMIVHRGPDDRAEVEGDGWWMGFQRLSILDLSDHGRQPMSFGGGRFMLTFNGEIYNFRELRAGLREVNLPSSGDTAVLGALLERAPVEQVLAELRGMFAIAWRDAETGSVVLARDHFGIKPLYYRTSESGELVYGSEVRAVRKLGDGCQVSRAALAQYFQWGAVQSPETLFDDVRCLPPGHMLVWSGGKAEVRRWFQPVWPGRDAWVHDAVEQKRLVREGVLESVKAHLVSDVPVGVFLSGGLDSTLLVACMREAGQKSIKAFSIGYEENAGVPDESDAARRTAEYFGCDFLRERLTADSLESRLDTYFDQMDQPTGDALNTWLVSRLASTEVKVTLSGLGADEWWAGYNYHRLIALAAKSPLLSAGWLARMADSLLPQVVRGHKAWKALFYALGGAGRDGREWQSFGRTIMPPHQVARLLHEECKMPSSPVFEPQSPDSWLHELLLRETETYLANTLLRDNDVMSMAHSLELRVPLVDREIFALAGRIPPESKLNTLGGKRVLREAFRELLPPHVYDDRQKKTFTLPLMKWMRLPKWQERIRDTLGSQRCCERGWVDEGRKREICEKYFSGSLDSKAAWPLSQRVWMLYVLEEWARRHYDETRKQR
jgi:asparagine synthase (glutamine-hydrolysing)